MLELLYKYYKFNIIFMIDEKNIRSESYIKKITNFIFENEKE